MSNVISTKSYFSVNIRTRLGGKQRRFSAVSAVFNAVVKILSVLFAFSFKYIREGCVFLPLVALEHGAFCYKIKIICIFVHGVVLGSYYTCSRRARSSPPHHLFPSRLGFYCRNAFFTRLSRKSDENHNNTGGVKFKAFLGV